MRQGGSRGGLVAGRSALGRHRRRHGTDRGWFPETQGAPVAGRFLRRLPGKRALARPAVVSIFHADMGKTGHCPHPTVRACASWADCCGNRHPRRDGLLRGGIKFCLPAPGRDGLRPRRRARPSGEEAGHRRRLLSSVPLPLEAVLRNWRYDVCSKGSFPRKQVSPDPGSSPGRESRLCRSDDTAV